MKTKRTTGTVRHGRRQAIGLAVAVAALSAGLGAQAQGLFSGNGSALPDSQFGTAGTTTITQGAGTGAGPGAGGWLTGPDPQPTDPADAAVYDPFAPPPGTTAQPPAEAATANAGTDAAQERPYEEDLNQPADEPLDTGDLPIDQPEWEPRPADADDAPGIRIGTFRLRPSVNQSINTERQRNGDITDTRHYLATGFRGTLTSDWSRHALTITGDGTFQRNVGGNLDTTDPRARIGADLRLDLADDTVAHITGAYDFEREDVADPNAIGNATRQSGVHQFEGEASVEREVGRIRALAAVGASRDIYTDATLSDGTIVSNKDRNRTGIDGRLRLGYELSPALVPFAEVALGHTFYDRRRDSSGYARSSDNYAGRLGLSFDMGEKLNGELAAGYEHVAYEDARLKSVDAFSLDGNVAWSPRRGTDVNFGLRTTVQDSTTAGQSGWVEYQLSTAVAHQMRDNLVARLTGSATFRDFQDGDANNVTWISGAGLTWNINRYLDMTGDVEYERTTGGGSEQDILRAGVGLTLRR